MEVDDTRPPTISAPGISVTFRAGPSAVTRSMTLSRPGSWPLEPESPRFEPPLQHLRGRRPESAAALPSRCVPPLERARRR